MNIWAQFSVGGFNVKWLRYEHSFTLFYLFYINFQLYMPVPFYSHCYIATCFSPQGVILRECWYISCSGSTKYVSRCKYQIKKKRIIRYLAVFKIFTCDHIEYKHKAKGRT